MSLNISDFNFFFFCKNLVGGSTPHPAERGVHTMTSMVILHFLLCAICIKQIEKTYGKSMAEFISSIATAPQLTFFVKF